MTRMPETRKMLEYLEEIRLAVLAMSKILQRMEMEGIPMDVPQFCCPTHHTQEEP